MFYVWSKTLGINNDDFTPGVPNLSEAETRRLDYSYIASDRPHNFVVNFVYQTPNVASGALGVLANDWQVSGLYRWTSGRPYNIAFNIPGIGAANLTGHRRQPRTRASCSRAIRAAAGAAIRIGRSTRRASRRRSPAATVPNRRASSCTRPPINNIDLSLSKRFRCAEDIGVRGAPRYVQRPEPHAVHWRQQHGELREPDRSDDHQPAVRRERQPGQPERLRHHQRRRASRASSSSSCGLRSDMV